MRVPGITRATVAVLALAIAGAPVARRLCGLACEAAPALAGAAGAPRAPHCAAHPPRPDRATPDTDPNPCGHGHGGDGALLTASAAPAKTGVGTGETPAPAPPAASNRSLLAPCGGPAGFDSRPAMQPLSTRRSILRL